MVPFLFAHCLKRESPFAFRAIATNYCFDGQPRTRGKQVANSANTTEINKHIERVLSDRVYWLVNEADFQASDPSRQRKHIFASLLALRDFVEQKTADQSAGGSQPQGGDRD